jgi:N-acetylneuraminic acid mutarotase
MAVDWTDVTALPAVRRGAQSIICRGWLYCIGGQQVSSSAVTTVYKAQIQSDGTLGAWSTEAALPVARRDGHAFLQGTNMLMVHGGFNSSEVALSTTVYATQTSASTGALSTWTTFGSCPAGYAPLKFSLHQGLSNQLVRIGGNGGTDGGTVAYTASMADCNFSVAAAIPFARSGHCSAYLNGYTYIFGGNTGSVTSSVHRTTTTVLSGAWGLTTSLPETSYDGGAFVLGGAVYVVLGGGSTMARSTKVYRGIPDAGGAIPSWTLHSNLSLSRGRFSKIPTYNGRAYVVGGETNGGAVSNVSMLWAVPQLPLTSVKPLGFNDGIGY